MQPLRDFPPRDPSLRVVGVPTRHDSAVRHVCGTAVYIDDLREPEGTLHLAPGGAPAARGRIVRIDLDAVRDAPGVVAVLTAADIPGKNDVSPVMGDDPMFATDAVEFHGQVVFAVVAATRDLARRAARLGKVEVAAEKPLVSVDDALAADAHILPDYAFNKGDCAAALAASPRRIAGTFRMGGQEHFYLEGQVALAIPGEDEMTVHSSTQHPSELQHIVAHVLGLPNAAVTVEVRRMGGAFGGKESQAAQWAAIAALAARITGRPCKFRLDRDDDMSLTGKRHDFRVDYQAGFGDDGRLAAVDIDLASRCGYSADLSGAINDRAMFHADNAYYLPAAHIVTRRMKTNTVSNTAFRGFGGPQGMLAIERVLDEIAWSLGVDPLDLRKANFYGPGRDMTPYGMQVTDNIMPELIEALERSSDYRARRTAIAEFNARSPILKRGLALTPIKFGISFTTSFLNQAGALVHVYQDGSVHLNHGGTEMGQGLFVKVAQVVAEEFGIDLDHVRITADHHRQGAQHVGDRGLFGLRSQRHGGASRGGGDQGAAHCVCRGELRRAGRPDQVPRQSGADRQPRDPVSGSRQAGLSRAHFAVLDRVLPHARHPLGRQEGDRPAVLLLLLWRGLRRGHHRYADRRNEGRTGRHPP